MSIFNFRKQRPNIFGASKTDERSENEKFIATYRKEITKAMNDERVCKLLGVESIFTDKIKSVPKMSREDFIYCMAHLYALPNVIDKAYRAFTSEFDDEYRGLIDNYIESREKDANDKKKIQEFFSLKNLSDCFAEAMANHHEDSEVNCDEYDKNGGGKEIQLFVDYINMKLDTSLSTMMLTNSFTGFSFVA